MQPADLEEVVKKGVKTVVIGRGMSEALQVGFCSMRNIELFGFPLAMIGVGGREDIYEALLRGEENSEMICCQEFLCS